MPIGNETGIGPAIRVVRHFIERRRFCQLKFASGEQALVLVAGMPAPSVEFVRLALGGLVPWESVWEYNPIRAGGYRWSSSVRSAPPPTTAGSSSSRPPRRWSRWRCSPTSPTARSNSPTAVAHYLPEFGHHGKDDVTVLQLLTMQGGFPQAPIGPDRWGTSDGRRAAFAEWHLDWPAGIAHRVPPGRRALGHRRTARDA